MHCSEPTEKAIKLHSRSIEHVAQMNGIWVIDMNIMHYTSVTYSWKRKYLDRRVFFSLCVLLHLLVLWCVVPELLLERVCALEEMKMWGSMGEGGRDKGSMGEGGREGEKEGGREGEKEGGMRRNGYW